MGVQDASCCAQGLARELQNPSNLRGTETMTQKAAERRPQRTRHTANIKKTGDQET
jgi:hypothetical protein